MSVAIVLASASASSETLTVDIDFSPDRCVTMTEGQVCYQRIHIDWSSNQVGHFCLYKSDQHTPLACWQNSDHGQAILDFANDHSQSYEFHQQITNNESRRLSSTQILVTWVYSEKQKRRNGWRLF